MQKKQYTWTYEDHLPQEQLGENKYAKATTAIGELICNAFDAEAKTVSIQIKENQLGGIESITIEDDGHGISPKDFEDRFLRVGVRPKYTGIRKFGRFGLGRFAVFRVGSLSEWHSTSKNHDSNETSSIQFRLSKTSSGPSDVIQTQTSEQSTGTKISIFNLLETNHKELDQQKLSSDLLSSFIAYLLTNPERRLVLNGTHIDPAQFVERTDKEDFVIQSNDTRFNANLRHIHLRRNAARDRFPSQLLVCGGGKLCATEDVSARVPSNYLAITDSQLLSDISNTNRESIAHMDPMYALLLEEVQQRITAFQKKDLVENAKRFLQEARSQKFYPFQATDTTPETTVKQLIYDVALEKLNESVDLSNLTKKQQAAVFQLLNRAMNNANVMDVLTEVAKLTDEDFGKFKRVLERTTLEQILSLSDEVTKRIQFLNSLHELTYGDISKNIYERTQLHKVIEKYTWIFGEKYRLATSDKSFRTLIARHRDELKLPPCDEGTLKDIKDVNKIPDLFLAAQRSFPTEPKHHNLIVEIKAPDVDIGTKEIAQIKQYASVVRNSAQLVKESSLWELYLVSSDIDPDVDPERNQEGRPSGLLMDNKGIKIWVFRWSELIQKSKEEMQLVSNHLRLKTEELAISEDLRKEFPFLVPLTSATQPSGTSATNTA